MTRDDAYIVKLKNAGIEDPVIAAKLGIEVEELNKRWLSIVSEAERSQKSGYGDMITAFTELCQKYNEVGNALAVVSLALSEKMQDEELFGLITEDRNETLVNLQRGAIVLRPFIYPTAEPPAPPSE